MLLEVLSNVSFYIDGFADASSNVWSWSVATEQEKLGWIRSIAGYFENVPFMGSYNELLESGWTFRVALNFIRDAVLLGALGWLTAWLLERRHLKQLTAREAELEHVSVEVGPKQLSEDVQASSNMFSGSIVLSHDQFRSLTILFSLIFGGNIKQYERLLMRARREAIIRLKEDALGQGFKRIVNMKMLTTNVKRRGPKAVEIIVYGTGVAS